MIFSGPRKWVKDFWGPELSPLTLTRYLSSTPSEERACLHSGSQSSVGDAAGAHHEDMWYQGKSLIGTLLWVGLDQRHKDGKTSAWFYLKHLPALFNILPLIFNFFFKSYFFGLSKEISTLMSEPWRETRTLCTQIEHFCILKTGQPRSFRKLTPLLDGTSW